MKFLKTEPTQEGTLRFANEFGLMGFSASNEIFRSWPDVDREVETFAMWKSETQAMRMLFESWQAEDEDWEWLQHQIDSTLTQHRVWPSFGRDFKRRKWLLRFAPRNLIGALWLQLAESIAGDKQWEGCPGCGQWLEVKAAAHRADRRYCSEACRAKAYRKRKQQAVALAAEGKTAKQIAQELGTDARKVAAWIKQAE